ncbi:MAG: hypothetical protein MI700_01830 [Balneolales bacterium]|nr:hypothetical protein [Balneolales bacterium]
MNIRFLFIVTFYVFGVSVVYSQTNPLYYDYAHNHLNWYTVESDHFLVHFQEGNERSAQVVSRIAEEIYTPITELYQHEPDEKVSIVLKDREDYSNGAAYFFDNKIDIWVPSLDTPLRGTHNWMRNVIAHEFTHIVQIQVAMKRSRSIPVLYFQWLNYEKVRRPDVLYGFPNGIISLPFATVNMPAWLAEGTAQYQTKELNYDSWDAHRDMILRTRVLSGTYLSLDEMSGFTSKTSLERETVYNQGFAFVIYLADRFGDDVLREITVQLAEKGVYTVEEAIELAIGIPGEEVFEDWIAERLARYEEIMAEKRLTESEYVEPGGFFNFYPRISSDGKSMAYLSNKGRDFSAVSLYLKTLDEEKEIALIDQDTPHLHHDHASSKPEIRFISTTFSFSPDGSKIVYAVNKKNEFAEDYRDLFIYNIESKENIRLTNSARIESPAWSPDGSTIAAVQYLKGTQNIVLLDPENPDKITPVTEFKDAETVFTPVWHPNGETIYFSYADFGPRTIKSIHLGSREISTILTDSEIDFRDPFISSDAKHLYFSASEHGIFNIFRSEIDDIHPVQITSVLGGAFMPFEADGVLYFSEYEKDGYKIKSLQIDPLLFPDNDFQFSDVPPPVDLNLSINEFNDKDLDAFPESVIAIADTGNYEFEIETRGQHNLRKYRSYEDTFLKTSFFPVLRFDNYSSLNGRNGALLTAGQFGDLGENLLRDMKPGVYFSSRDVLDKFSLFGGIMLGVGSKSAEGIGDFFSPNRLSRLDRDIFLLAEFRGVPFIKKGWSPTVSIEIYNLHRGVQDGLSIEEFPCTSCLPDTSYIDIGYEVWEAGLYLRSKLSRRSLFEIGLRYSPYRIITDNFYSQELQAFISGSNYEYFRATTLSAAYTFNYYLYSVDGDIAPIGLKGYLRYQYQPARLLEEYEIEDGSLVPIFADTDNHSTELHVRYGFKTFGNQAFQARIRGFTYFNNPDDAFYTDYVGGFLGMRSYPFFAIAGNTTAFTSLSWFAPIYKNINKQAGPYTLDKVYARFFFEAGNGWFLGNSTDTETANRLGTGNNLKTGIGAELRLATNGYYLFPLKFFVSTTYGFNKFSVTLPEEFVTGTSSNNVTYGREFLFHFGLTFDFELL